MQTKIVYTLVSDYGDYYCEQAMMSLHSLRKHHPTATVELVVDNRTDDTLCGKRAEIIKYVSKKTCIELPEEYDKMRRSRHIKTNLRKYVTGDFLFIDCDTVVCAPLDAIDNFEGEMGLAADLNHPLPLEDKNTIEKCENAGFKNLAGAPYYNSGVMLVKDTPATHKFYEAWNRNWLLSVQNGVPYDQPALCQTNKEAGFPIKELPGAWNCQIKFDGARFIKSAKIMHYYFGGSEKYSLGINSLLEHVKKEGKIDEIITKIIDHPQTTLYTYLTMPEEKLQGYRGSELIYVYANVPPLFRLLEIIARPLAKIAIIIGKIKAKIIQK